MLPKWPLQDSGMPGPRLRCRLLDAQPESAWGHSGDAGSTSAAAAAFARLIPDAGEQLTPTSVWHLRRRCDNCPKNDHERDSSLSPRFFRRVPSGTPSLIAC